MPYDKERLLKQKNRYESADKDLASLKDNKTSDIKFVHRKLKDYLMIRLLLTEEEMKSDSLKDIIELNLKKQQEMLKNGVKLEDVLAPGCAGITGEAAKKIYLLLTIQNVLGIKFDEMKTPYIETVWDLAKEVCELL